MTPAEKEALQEQRGSIAVINRLETELAAAEARELALREALETVSEIACRSAGGNVPEDVPEPANRDGEELHDVALAALSAPRDTAALRAFGLKVIIAASSHVSRAGRSDEAIVDAVLGRR